MSCKKNNGPGYKTPLDAFSNGKKEVILYTVCINPNPEVTNKPDYLATVDVDPKSSTYSQVIHRTYVGKIGDELHHFGWNSCSSCFGDCSKKRNKIILPALGSDRIYILDVTDERMPKLYKTIEPEEVHALNVSSLHTTHCLPNGSVMISTMGDAEGNEKGDFLLIDANEGVVKETWTIGKTAKFGYDFWYQPYWDILVSSEWGTPKFFKTGFHPEHVNNPGMITDILISLDDKYLYFSNWLHGDIRQYNITDTKNPQLICQLFLGGVLTKGSPLTVIRDLELKEQPMPVYIKNRRLYGSPQMLQLSLDGKRLYVTTALFTPWDKEFYPESVKNGSTLVKLDIDHLNGGMTLDYSFLVDFGKEPIGPVMAHETRYPGGDCTSDIWMNDEK
ncbi:methanethiol oxidase [Daktulosphaira vitifoliae]|uniref:methanethiol oxidase n=1 Tax=Daktulosphaira vitifoliae TaxID=58002 RepID=UPI0021AA46B2|nr:methanethiol oxidase [Daktulosphaira vitifoliae]